MWCGYWTPLLSWIILRSVCHRDHDNKTDYILHSLSNKTCLLGYLGYYNAYMYIFRRSSFLYDNFCYHNLPFSQTFFLISHIHIHKFGQILHKALKWNNTIIISQICWILFNLNYRLLFLMLNFVHVTYQLPHWTNNMLSNIWEKANLICLIFWPGWERITTLMSSCVNSQIFVILQTYANL